MKRILHALVIGCLSLSMTVAQTYQGKFVEANYDESNVPDYTLPPVLTSFDEKVIDTVEAWENTRRPEIIKFFAQNIYGDIPQPSSPLQKSFELLS